MTFYTIKLTHWNWKPWIVLGSQNGDTSNNWMRFGLWQVHLNYYSCKHEWDLYAYTTKPLVMQGTGVVDQHRAAYATKKCRCKKCGDYETFVVD